MEWRWWISGIRFGDVALESALPRDALSGLYWKVIGWYLLIGVLFAGYLFLCAALVASLSQTPMAKMFVPGHVQGSVPMLVATGIGYLAIILTLNVVMRVYLMRDLWVRLVGSTTVHGLEAAANVAAQRRSGKRGRRGPCRRARCGRVLAHECDAAMDSGTENVSAPPEQAVLRSISTASRAAAAW